MLYEFEMESRHILIDPCESFLISFEKWISLVSSFERVIPICRSLHCSFVPMLISFIRSLTREDGCIYFAISMTYAYLITCDTTPNIVIEKGARNWNFVDKQNALSFHIKKVKFLQMQYMETFEREKLQDKIPNMSIWVPWQFC